jgi:hypothetical protein
MYDPRIGVRYSGIAAAVIWKFYNDYRLLSYWCPQTQKTLPYPEAAYPVAMQEEATGELAIRELPKLRKVLRRSLRGLQLLAKSTLLPSRLRDPMHTYAEMKTCACAAIDTLNDQYERQLEFYWQAQKKKYPGTREQFLATLTNIDFWDNVTVTQLKATHCRPLQVAGLWVDFGTDDPQAPTRVLLAFNDARMANARYDMARTKFLTRYICLHNGWNQLLLHGNDWAQATDMKWSTLGRPSILFIPWEEM